MANAEIDQLILDACDGNWRKVARIVALASEKAGLDDKSWGNDTVAKRLRVLVRNGRLEAIGNLWDWRASEVRLPGRSLPNGN